MPVFDALPVLQTVLRVVAAIYLLWRACKIAFAVPPETTAKAASPLTFFQSAAFQGVNDLVFSAAGELYFTDQGQSGMHDQTGRVFRYRVETGQLDCLPHNGPSPNGPLDLEDNALFVAMTRGNAVWRNPLLPDDGTSKVGIFTSMAGGLSGADGMALGNEGNIYVCDVGNGCVWVFTPRFIPIYRIAACTMGLTLTNLALGGKGNRSLYITGSSSGQILKANLPHKGQLMYSHR